MSGLSELVTYIHDIVVIFVGKHTQNKTQQMNKSINQDFFLIYMTCTMNISFKLDSIRYRDIKYIYLMISK